MCIRHITLAHRLEAATRVCSVRTSAPALQSDEFARVQEPLLCSPKAHVAQTHLHSLMFFSRPPAVGRICAGAGAAVPPDIALPHLQPLPGAAFAAVRCHALTGLLRARAA